jgi:hypothetical protein
MSQKRRDKIARRARRRDRVRRIERSEIGNPDPFDQDDEPFDPETEARIEGWVEVERTMMLHPEYRLPICPHCFSFLVEFGSGDSKLWFCDAGDCPSIDPPTFPGDQPIAYHRSWSWCSECLVWHEAMCDH